MSERSSTSEERLTAALRSLPREQARPGFTGRVLRRLDEDRPGAAGAPARWVWMTAAAAVVVLALSFGWRDWRHQQERAENLARLETLLIDKQELEAELESLQRLTAEARPVVYLGGDEKVELMLDLVRFHRRGGFGSRTTARPFQPQPADLRPADLQPTGRYETLRVVY